MGWLTDVGRLVGGRSEGGGRQLGGWMGEVGGWMSGRR